MRWLATIVSILKELGIEIPRKQCMKKLEEEFERMYL